MNSSGNYYQHPKKRVIASMSLEATAAIATDLQQQQQQQQQQHQQPPASLAAHPQPPSYAQHLPPLHTAAAASAAAHPVASGTATMGAAQLPQLQMLPPRVRPQMMMMMPSAAGSGPQLSSDDTESDSDTDPTNSATATAQAPKPLLAAGKSKRTRRLNHKQHPEQPGGGLSSDDDDSDSDDDDDDDEEDESDTSSEGDGTTGSETELPRKRARLDREAGGRRLEAALFGIGEEEPAASASSASASATTPTPAATATVPPISSGRSGGLFSPPRARQSPLKAGAAAAASGLHRLGVVPVHSLSADDSSSCDESGSGSGSGSGGAPQFGRKPVAAAASALATGGSGGGDSFNSYSNKSMAMMRKMGFNPDAGLGKQSQGRLAPIEVSDQRGRRGLGLRLDGLDAAAETFDATREVVEMREPVNWLKAGAEAAAQLDELSLDDLERWLQVREAPKMRLDDETEFVEAQVLREVLAAKTNFDNLGVTDMRRARTRSNPFETIRGSIFLNRAAVKMSNMDSRLDFMFTKPVDERGASLVREDDLLYFADVCAGPGGFSEYVLWRKGWQAKGFGFTLRSENDFKLHDFFAGSPETFNPFYGVKGDGNVFDPENVESFVRHVRDETGDRGVHFMMADGGFSVEGQENIQEILSKQLYLCQCLVALGIVRTAGHFVCKLFDLFTPFSVGLLYLLRRCFREICIFKPNTSRPANSERYLICKWKHASTETVYRHLFDVNRTMWTNSRSGSTADISHLVDPAVLRDDADFLAYVHESNTRIGRNQIAGLLKIAAYCKDPALSETRQSEIRRDCLRLWQIPDAMRRAPERKGTEKLLTELLEGWHTKREFLTEAGMQLDGRSVLDKAFRELKDWHFVAVDTVEQSCRQFRTMLMSKGGREVLRMTANGSWQPLTELAVELAPNTLLYAEIVRELQGEGRSQVATNALHIIDAIRLGGVDVRQRGLRERMRMCEKFAMAMNKAGGAAASAGAEGQNGGGGGQAAAAGALAPIRCKKLFAMRDFGEFFDRLTHYRLKDGNVRYGMQLRTGQEGRSDQRRFFVPRGMLFLNEVKPYLERAFSRSQQKMYYIDRFTKKTFFEDQIEDPSWIVASFRMVYSGRTLWPWVQADQVAEELEMERTTGLLYRVDFKRFIDERLAKEKEGGGGQQLAAGASTSGR